MNAERIATVAVAFLAVGLSVALVSVSATSWAETAFMTDAGGDVSQFGPIFVAQLYLTVTAAALIGAPVFAGAIGFVVGARTFGPAEAAATAGVGSAIGAVGYAVVVVGLVVLFQGAAAEQAYSAGDALGSIGATVVVSTLVSATTAVVGTWVR